MSAPLVMDSGLMEATYYGAYGSNLNRQQMHIRCPASKPVEGTYLTDRTLVFKSVADVISDPGNRVPVGVYVITKCCERALDRYEGYPRHYGKEYLNVELKGRSVQVMIYVLNKSYGFGEPSKKYFEVIRQGYDEWDFDHKFLFAAREFSIKNDLGNSYRSRVWG